MNKQDIQNFVENNPQLVSKRATSKDGLFVLKYKKSVFYNNLWNEYLEECRGTIIDAEYNVIQRPFTKIYNYGIEANSPKLSDDTLVTAYRKVNGFMAAITYYNNELLISTTGSINSQFVDYIIESIDYDRYIQVCKQYPTFTFLFECVHPLDPHIIPEKFGMYLLGYREKTWESVVDIDSMLYDFFVRQFDCFSCERALTTISNLLKITQHVKHEGFVFYTSNGVSAKLKSPYYLIQKALARKKDIMSLNKQIVDEEYYPLIEHLTSIKESFNELGEQQRLEYIRNWISSN